MVRRLLAGAAVAALLGAQLGASPAVAASGLEFRQAISGGRACMNGITYGSGQPEFKFDCTPTTWSEQLPAGAGTWHVLQSKAATATLPNGIPLATSWFQDQTTTVRRDASGGFEAIEVEGEFRSTVTGGGGGFSNLQFAIDFDSNSDALYVTGGLEYEVTGVVGVLDDIEAHPGAQGDVSVSVQPQCPVGFAPKAENQLALLRHAGGQGNPIDQSPSLSGTDPIDRTLALTPGRCRVQIVVRSEAYVVQLASRESAGTSKAKVKLRVGVTPPSCTFAGIVRDGSEAIDGHANPMRKVAVEAFKDDVDDTKPPAARVLTDAEGRYCFNNLDPADYQVRALLSDRATLEVRTGGANGSIPTATISVKPADVGRDDLDIDFSGAVAEDSSPNAANVYWQSRRFLDLLLQGGTLPADKLGLLRMYFSDRSTSQEPTEYDPTTEAIRISAIDQLYTSRNTALSPCPENCEWHEIAHYVADKLGIANDPKTCASRFTYAFFENETSCRSLEEAFAIWLPTLESVALDLDSGAGYGTPDYGGIVNLEANDYRPDSVVRNDDAEGFWISAEYLAAAQLLWDLSDGTPKETGTTLEWTGGINRLKWGVTLKEATKVKVPDEIALDLSELVGLMAARHVQTVADLFDALDKSGKFPPPRLSADIEEVFVLHGFHPNRTLLWLYVFGDNLGITDVYGQDTTTVVRPRRSIPLVSGSGIELTNGGTTPATFTLDVPYETTTSHFEVTVGPNSSQVVYLQLPPYWHSDTDPKAALPACGGDGQEVVSLAVSGAGQAARTVDSCEYWHAIETATGESAFTYGSPISTPGPGPSGVPPTSGDTSSAPAVVIVAVAAAVALAIMGVGFIAIRRRSRSSVPPGA